MADTTPSTLDARSVSIWPTAWKYALIIAAVTVIYNLLSYTTVLGAIPGSGLVGWIIMVVLLVLALKSFRSSNNGYMTFGQGFGVAFVASAIAVIIRGAVSAIYFSAFGREQLNTQLEEVMAQVRANPGVDAQTLEVLRGFFEAVFTPAGIFVSGAVFGVIGWAIASLILAAIMKNAPPVSD